MRKNGKTGNKLEERNEKGMEEKELGVIIRRKFKLLLTLHHSVPV
jgi:hypothetical protein